MPAKNAEHDLVRDALVADGWTITDDPLTLRVGGRSLHIDLGAEKSPIAAERAGELIAVEIQSFGSPSVVADLHQAVGQFAVYRLFLAERQPERVLFLAVPSEVYDGILSEPLGGGGGRQVGRPAHPVRPGRAGGVEMDQVARYRDIIRRVLQEFVDWVSASPSAKDIRYEVVFDPALDHFQVVYSGWEGHRYIHGSPYHLDIINGKIWIQFDGTDRPIADELLAAGVPPTDIVLGDRTPRRRALSGLAVG